MQEQPIHWAALILSSGIINYDPQVSYTIPDGAVHTAADIGITLAECTPVHRRDWQLEMKVKICLNRAFFMLSVVW